MRLKPEIQVMQWLETQDVDNLYITSVSMAEIYFGLYRMLDGKRKKGLLSQFHCILQETFQDRLLDFTHKESVIYAEICSHAEEIGRTMSIADAQIASIAKFHHAIVATRNVKYFEHCGVEVVNSFEYG